MKITKIHDQIWEVTDFLSEDRLNILLNIANNSDDQLWYQPDAPEYWQGKVLMISEFFEIDDYFVENLDTDLTNLFINSTNVLPVSTIIRYRVGEGKGVHRDNDGEKDLLNVYGLVFYLNDDYQGGELYYPGLDFEIKPKKNSVLIHYAGIEHGVRDVKSGIRYVITSFIQGTQETKVREN